MAWLSGTSSRAFRWRSLALEFVRGADEDEDHRREKGHGKGSNLSRGARLAPRPSLVSFTTARLPDGRGVLPDQRPSSPLIGGKPG
jgi:hypothetical protein